MSLHQIKKISVTDQILFQLEREILWGSWKPGYQIPSEITLARQLQVSRASVTMALDILRDRNILVTLPGKGTFVNEKIDTLSFQVRGILDPRENEPLKTIVEFLRMILLPATQLAVEKTGPATTAATDPEKTDIGGDTVANLAQLCLKMSSCKDSPDAFSELDYQFYREILRCAGNAPLLRIYENAREVIIYTLANLNQLADTDVRIRQHTQLLQCFEKRDPFRARILMNQECHYLSTLLSEASHD